MRRPLPPIHESLADLQARLRQCRDGRLKWRLQLLVLIKKGDVSSRQEAALRQALQARLAEPQDFGSYEEVRHWLYDEFGQRFAYSTVHRWVRDKLKAKLKRPRPEHPKKKSLRPPPSPSASIGG